MNAEREKRHWFVTVFNGLQVAAFIGVAVGLWLLYQDFSFARRSVATQAQVVDVIYGRAVPGAPGTIPETQKFPVFAFTDGAGARHQVRSTTALSGRFIPGEMRDILYDPAAPGARVELAGWHPVTGLGGIVLMASAPMAALFAWGHIRERRRKEQQRLRRNRKARERRARRKAEQQAAASGDTPPSDGSDT